MNIRDLKYLVAVYDQQSFSKAAAQCFVSQPTLSGQVKKLETTLGAALIERSTRRVLFTPIGEKVVAQARQVLETTEHIKLIAQQNDDPMDGDFHIGLIPTIGPFLLPRIMPSLVKSFPQSKLFLYELQTEALIDRLLKGELDAVILAKLDWRHAVTEWPLYSENFRLAISNADPLAEKNVGINRSALDGRAVLMLEDGHCLRDQALGVCFAEGAHEDKSFQATSMNTLLHMVAAGAGSTLVPELACNKAVKGVAYLPFANTPPSREVVMLTRRGSTRETALKAFADKIASLIQ